MKLSKTYVKINAKSMGDRGLLYNKSIVELSLPRVQTIGYSFLHHNKSMTELDLPVVQTIGRGFLYCNEYITKEQFIP